MDNITKADSNGSYPPENLPTGGDIVREEVYRALGVLSIVIMLIGIPGNFLVIAAISLNKHMRTAANFLVLSLSIFDFLYLTTLIPVHTYCYFTAWEPPEKTCWALGFATNWLLGCSILSTGSIAINRYIVIVLKNKYQQINGNKAVVITWVMVFIFPAILLSPAFFDSSLGTFGKEKYNRLCGWAGKETLKTITIGCVAIFPLVFMTFCYVRILVFVISSRKRVHAIGQTNGVNGNSRRTKEAKLTQMLAMVYVVYLLTTLPSLSVNLASQIGVPIQGSTRPIAFVVVWVSSAANPVMYGFVNQKYRDAYKSVVWTATSFTRQNTSNGTSETNV